MVIHQIIEAAPQSRSCALLDAHDVPFHCLMGTAHTSAHDKTLEDGLSSNARVGDEEEEIQERDVFALWFPLVLHLVISTNIWGDEAACK